jgi:catabolite regulation protein CreA
MVSPATSAKGALGVAEDTSDASIACRQIGPIKIKGDIKDGERVFDERRSLIFKTLRVVRFFDSNPPDAAIARMLCFIFVSLPFAFARRRSFFVGSLA